MKLYKVHYEQVNAGWIEIEASSKKAAINKACRELRNISPELDCIELPNGEQEDIEP